MQIKTMMRRPLPSKLTKNYDQQCREGYSEAGTFPHIRYYKWQNPFGKQLAICFQGHKYVYNLDQLSHFLNSILDKSDKLQKKKFAQRFSLPK